MVSSLIGPQYHEDQFWTFTESAPDHQTNNFDVPVVPTFSEDFEVSSRQQFLPNLPDQYAHFHGTDDGTIRYDGQNPGPGFLAGAEVYAAQL